MIGRLAGTLIEKHDDGTAIVDCGGVGYLCHCPLSTLAALNPGEPATLTILTLVREDAIQLVGFATPLERDVFLLLTGVDKVGPKVALAILSVLTVGELAKAVLRNDKAAFTKVSGVGDKLAARILVELSDRIAKRPDLMREAQLAETGRASHPGVTVAPPKPKQRHAELVELLTTAGYRPSDINRVLDSIDEVGLADAPLNQQFREVAKLLTRGKLIKEG
jgi:holliday junction DNA helicase RuvA